MTRKIHLSPSQDADRSRLFAIAFLRFFLRVCRRKIDLFDGDIHLAIIAEAVAIAGVDAALRDPAFKTEFSSLSAVVGVERQRGCNALSIAETTGLPRETVRRKLQRLEELGIVLKLAKGGYVLQPGVIQGDTYGGLFRDLEAESLRLLNECLAEEFFVLES